MHNVNSAIHVHNNFMIGTLKFPLACYGCLLTSNSPCQHKIHKGSWRVFAPSLSGSGTTQMPGAQHTCLHASLAMNAKECVAGIVFSQRFANISVYECPAAMPFQQLWLTCHCKNYSPLAQHWPYGGSIWPKVIETSFDWVPHKAADDHVSDT